LCCSRGTVVIDALPDMRLPCLNWLLAADCGESSPTDGT
jgi:hypothetical protein